MIESIVSVTWDPCRSEPNAPDSLREPNVPFVVVANLELAPPYDERRARPIASDSFDSSRPPLAS